MRGKALTALALGLVASTTMADGLDVAWANQKMESRSHRTKDWASKKAARRAKDRAAAKSRRDQRRRGG